MHFLLRNIRNSLRLNILSVDKIVRQSTPRRRIKTEEKAKVVDSAWGEDFIQFLAALGHVLHWMI